MSIGDVRKVHVLAEFPCCKCGKPHLTLTCAPVMNGLICSPAESVARSQCNACHALERDAMQAEYKAAQKRRAWAKKHGVKPPRVSRPRGGA